MDELTARVNKLEQQHRQMRFALFALLCFCAAVLSMSRLNAQPSSTEPLRARGLIIEDSAGRARIVIGAPIPGDGRSANLRTGFRMNDPNGVERLGFTLDERGAIVLGLDAPPGKGDDRNRERITLVADQDGGAYIRFLDRRTSVPARLYLDDLNRVWLEFSDYTQQPAVRKRIGLSGEETIRGTP